MREDGFSLIEIMIAVAIFSLVIGAAFQAHLTMSRANITETAKLEGQFESTIELQILENDMKNAGFCVPDVCAIASKDSLTSLEAVDWEGFTSGDVGGNYSKIIGTDRLYLADLGEIVEDFSSDGTESGALTDGEYTTMVTVKLSSSDGYSAALSSDASIGDSSITIISGNRDIDSSDSGASDDYDFKADRALIIANTSGNPPEGRMIDSSHSSDSTIVSFLENEAMEGAFVAADSVVAPAICYHLQKPQGSSPFHDQVQVFTLTRNSDPFLEGVEAFQVAYHYDTNDNGDWEDISSEWIDELPGSYDPKLLRSIKVIIVVRASNRQTNEAESRDSVSLEILDSGGSVIRTLNTLNLTTEMKHYYRKEFTIEVVPRNMRKRS